MTSDAPFTVAMARRIELWPIDRLVPYDRNSRLHSPEQIAQVAASISEFGFTNPILVDSNDGIVAGHGRLAAARELGMDQVPVVVLDHLSERQKRAYVIADNKLALNASWDMELLRQEMMSLKLADFGLELLGFDENELAELLGDDDFEDGVDAREAVDESDDADTQVVIGSYRFPLERHLYFQWRDAMREQVGFEEDDIKAEIRRRLQIPA